MIYRDTNPRNGRLRFALAGISTLERKLILIFDAFNETGRADHTLNFETVQSASFFTYVVDKSVLSFGF